MELEFSQVEKEWKAARALDGVSFTVKDKEFVAILGPSGCGKTTTLMLLAGIYKPSGGSILFDGSVVNDVESKDRNVSVVFQSYALYPHLSILDNILFPLQFKRPRVAKEEARRRAVEAASLVNVEELLDRMPHQLSGGQQQRVALARGIVKEPGLFLLDEPLSNLDASLRMSVRAELRKLHRKLEVTTVLVTHDQVEAAALADRIICMNVGKIAQIGTSDELYGQPENLFVAKFIGSPSINILKASVKEGFYYLHDSRCGKSEYADGDYYYGIRPEDIGLGAGGKFKGAVIDKEVLGRETLITVESEIGTLNILTAKGSEGEALSLEDNIRFSPIEGRGHLFAVSTEKRVGAVTAL